MSKSSYNNEKTHLDDPDTNNATYIGWSNWSNNEYWPADYSIPKKSAYYRNLDRYNSGLQNGNWQNKRYQTFWLNREEVFNLGSNLEMENWQLRRATKLTTGEIRSKLGLESTQVLISLCGYILHDSPGERKCHPQTKEEDFDGKIAQMLEEHDIRRTDYDKTYRKIQRIDKRETRERTKVRDNFGVDLKSKQMWREIRADGEDGWL